MLRAANGKQGNRRRSLTTRYCLVLSACCLLTSAFYSSDDVSAATGAWMRQPSGTLAWLYSVFFLNQNRGWAAGSKGILLLTTDGGKSWRPGSRPTEDTLRDIYFIDEKNGWLVCERNIYDLKTKDEPRSYLMSTSDGGWHWKRVDVRGEPDIRLVRAVFTRAGHGWTFGEGGVVYRTRDSGQTWVRLHVPSRHLLLGGMFIDDDRGWIVGAGGTILQTSDGGETWHLSRLADTEDMRFTGASFVNNRLGWAVGSGGRIFCTVNGGRTWQAQNSGVSIDLYDVKFLDALEGWVAGAEGTVIHTSDGGLHWSVEPSDTRHPLERLFFTDRQHGWAVGFGGTIISYVRAGVPGLRRR
jgi:photosystem II stability/assembly factor-like uncharacterized protein